MSNLIPYGRHHIEEDDIEAVVDVLRSDNLTGGPVVEDFEKAFADRVGAKYAIAVSSGTAGLHLASVVLGLTKESFVIVPTVTFLATANAPAYCGANIVFADVNKDTGLMGPSELEEAFERADGRVEAVFLVHLNGQCSDMEAIKSVCDAHGTKIIEDACHALGGEYQTADDCWHPVGSCKHSDMAVFSMHPVKNIAMGEGGMITTNEYRIARLLRNFRNHGIIREPEDFENKDLAFDSKKKPNPWYYEMQHLGYNYRASAIHCALGRSQLRKLDRFVLRRREIANAYEKALEPLASVIKPIPSAPRSRHAWHLFVVRINQSRLNMSRADLMNHLRKKGIGTQVHYRPVHTQNYYQGNGAADISCPSAEAYYTSCLTLPLFSDPSAECLPSRVTETLQDIIKDE